MKNAVYTMPPELLLQILINLGTSGMNGIRGFVWLLHNELLQTIHIRYTKAIVIPKNSFRINLESCHFLLSHTMLDPFDTLMSFLAFLDLIYQGRF
jgi:hypothetical protein